MATGLVYDDRFLEHDTGPGHPERPDRLRAIVERLKRDHLWPRMIPLSFEPADWDWIHRLHDPVYTRRLVAACEQGEPHIDTSESAIVPASAEIARLAVGGGFAAVDAVLGGQLDNALCLLRPPGHHAEADRSMGFCLLNNIALAAEYALAHHGLKRVAIVDFDVHHGNGTQHLFEARAEVLVINLHEHPRHLYPGTGFVHERGEGEGEGTTLNIPLDPGSGDDTYRHAMVFHVMPALQKFEPELLLVSAGFDAAAADPLAHLEVTPAGFEWIARFLRQQASALCDGRLIAMLEGGYELDALARGVSHLARTLLEEGGTPEHMAAKAGFL